MSDRDILVIIAGIVVAAVIGTFDALLDVDPEGNDGLISAGLVFAATMFFYRLGKGPKNGGK